MPAPLGPKTSAEDNSLPDGSEDVRTFPGCSDILVFSMLSVASSLNGPKFATVKSNSISSLHR